MSDYPSDEEVRTWVNTTPLPPVGSHGRMLGAAVDAVTVMEIVRHAVDCAVFWARANPAPQEPPTAGGITRDEAQRIADAMAHVWPHSLGEAVYALNCADLPFRFRTSVAPGPGPGHVVHIEPVEPTEAPKPTSGDKPPLHHIEHVKRVVADPRNRLDPPKESEG